MTKDEILVIKSEIEMSSAERSLLARNIRRQIEEIGVVILPPYLEPLIVPAGLEIRIEEGAE